MAVAVASSNTGTSNWATDTTLTIPAPTGIARDDLLLIIIGYDPVKTPTPPSGFALVTGSQNTAFNTAVATYWKTAAPADETAVSYAVTFGSTGTFSSGVILCITGASTTFSAATNGNSSYSQVEGPTTLSTTVDGSLVIWGITSPYEFTAPDETTYSATNIRHIAYNSNYATVDVTSTLKATAGSVSPIASATWSNPWHSNAVSIAPGTPPSPPVGKPASGILDTAAALASGMYYFAPFNEGTGSTIHDLASNMSATMVGTSSWGTNLNDEPAMVVTAVDSGAVTGQLASGIQYGWPITLACGFITSGTYPSAASAVASITDTGFTESVISFYRDSGAATGGIEWRSGSTYASYTITSADFPLSSYVTYAVEITSTTVKAYLNGSLVHTDTVASSNPTYYQPTFAPGYNGTRSRNPQITMDWMAVWNRTLSTDEHTALADASNLWALIITLAGGPLSLMMDF